MSLSDFSRGEKRKKLMLSEWFGERDNMFFSEGEFINFLRDFRAKNSIGFVANCPIEHGVSLSGKAEKVLYV